MSISTVAVTLAAPSREIMAYCYYRVCDLWPKAILLASCKNFRSPADAEPYIARRPRGLHCVDTPCCRIYQSEDMYLSEILLGRMTPSLQISLDGDSVELAAHPDALEALQLLHRLPLWAHTARISNRLEVEDGKPQSVR